MNQIKTVQLPEGLGYYKIPQGNIHKLTKAIDKLNRKAKQINCPLIDFKQVATWKHRTITKQDPFATRPKVFGIFKIVGDAPCIDGWNLIGHADCMHSEPVFSMHNNATVPKVIKNREDISNCDHCHTSRNRKDVYIIERDNEFKTIGRNCLALFLGGRDPKSVAKWLTVVYNTIHDGCEDPEDYQSEPQPEMQVDLMQFMVLTVAVIERDGWMSKSRSNALAESSANGQGPQPTSHEVITQAYPPTNPKYYDPVTVTPEHRIEAVKAIEWAINCERNNDYLYNISVLANDGWFRFRELGLAVSIIASYQRAMNRLKEIELAKSRTKDSEHFGTIKKREVFNLEVVSVFDHEGAYGVTHIHRMIEGTGNSAVWFSSSTKLDPGTHKVKATVKDHKDDPKYGKQTVLTRVTVV